MNPAEPAYEDMSVGSQFLWDLNNAEIPEVKLLAIAGMQDLSMIVPCVPFEAEDSDGLVSVAGVSLLKQDEPLIVMKKNHKTIYSKVGKDIRFWDLVWASFNPNLFSIAKPLILQYLAIVTDISDVTNIIDDFINNGNYRSHLDNGEVYLKLNDTHADQNPFTEGMALLKFTNPREINGGSVLIKKDANGYNFGPNPDSGIYYHFNEDEEADDYGLTIPEGTYDLYVDDLDTLLDIKIDAAQTNLYELTLCTPNWTLQEEWGACQLNDLQFKDWIDLNSCGFESTKPESLNQSCDFCIPNWTEIIGEECLEGDTLYPHSKFINYAFFF